MYQASLDLIPHKKVSSPGPLLLSVSTLFTDPDGLVVSFQFTFAKIWLLYAQFEIRQKNLQGARRIMVRPLPCVHGFPRRSRCTTREPPVVLLQGTAIGKCPKNKLLKGYIELELQLREFDRCRKLYEKYLEFSPENCTTWIKFSELETILGDVERARAIFELAIGQPRLDMPEVPTSLYISVSPKEIVNLFFILCIQRFLTLFSFR